MKKISVTFSKTKDGREIAGGKQTFSSEKKCEQFLRAMHKLHRSQGPASGKLVVSIETEKA